MEAEGENREEEQKLDKNWTKSSILMRWKEIFLEISFSVSFFVYNSLFSARFTSYGMANLSCFLFL